MIRVAAITSGRNVPSTRFRIRQHIKPLGEYGISVREYCPAIGKDATLDAFGRLMPRGVRMRYLPPMYVAALALSAAKFASVLPGVVMSRFHDVVWLSRALFEGYPTLEWALKKPLVLDVDDAVWNNGPFGKAQMRKIGKLACCVVAGNTYLAEWFSQVNANVVIAPTAVDIDRFSPQFRDASRPFTVGWTGTNGNFKYLYTINNALRRFFESAPNARMLVIADKYPDKLNVPREQLEFIKWTPENEANTVQEMDVGLMPLEDDEWTRGKCSFKMLQYMACGKPVIVSPVGMNLEVLKKTNVGFGPLNENEWLDALFFLYQNPEKALRLGENARSVIEQYYSQEAVSKILGQVFASVR